MRARGRVGRCHASVEENPLFLRPLSRSRTDAAFGGRGILGRCVCRRSMTPAPDASERRDAFDDLAHTWWDEGRMLHALGVLLAPVRVPFVLDVGAGGGFSLKLSFVRVIWSSRWILLCHLYALGGHTAWPPGRVSSTREE